MVKHSLGEGSYSGDGAGSVESTLTGIYPYAALDVSARLRAWAAAGLGEGTLTLTPKNPETGEADPALETDMSLGLAALGAKGTLVAPAGGAGSGSTWRPTRSGCGPPRRRRRGSRRRKPT